MSAIVFVDTNILVYAHDADAGPKRPRAVAVLRTLWNDGCGRLSPQVLQEFYVNATRKLATPLAHSIAREVVAAYADWVRHPTEAATVMRAIDLAAAARLSFWDALVLAAAEQAAATEIYSEDLNVGQSIAGIRIVNPLAG